MSPTETPVQGAQSAERKSRSRVGVVLASPLLALGLVDILEANLRVDAFALELDALPQHALDAVILDGRCVLEDLCSTITRLRKRLPNLRIVALGWPLSADDIRKVIGIGAKGYLLDSAGEDEIRMAIEVVLDGSIWAPRKVLATLIEANATAAENVQAESPAEELSARELEVMNLLMSGRSNREIASALGIEPATVKAHLGRMLRKTHSKNRLEMTLRSVEQKAAEQTKSAKPVAHPLVRD